MSLSLVDGELAFADGVRHPAGAGHGHRRRLTMVSGGDLRVDLRPIALDVPAVSFARPARRCSSTPPAASRATIPRKTVRLTASDVHLVIAGQEIGGTFVVAVQTIGGVDNNLNTLRRQRTGHQHRDRRPDPEVGPPASPFINVTEANGWSGAMLLTSKGMAATFPANLTGV